MLWKNGGGCRVCSAWWSPVSCSSTSPVSGLTSSRPLLNRDPSPTMTSCVHMGVRMTQSFPFLFLFFPVKPAKGQKCLQAAGCLLSFTYCSFCLYLWSFCLTFVRKLSGFLKGFFFFASLSLFSSVCCVRLEIMEWKRKYFPYCTDEQSLICFFFYVSIFWCIDI